MSKAFLRESDSDVEPDSPVPVAVLPPGAKNYLTAGGVRRLQEELRRLTEDERPALAARLPDPEARQALNVLDRRVRYVQESLRTAVVGEDAGPADVVRFGATVTLREPDGSQDRYRIVGVDEADAGRNWISWQSPLARAIMQARRGQRVKFIRPRGPVELEIVEIAYEE